MRQLGNLNCKFTKTGIEVRTEITVGGIFNPGTEGVTDQTMETEDNTDKTGIGPVMDKIIGGNFGRDTMDYDR